MFAELVSRLSNITVNFSPVLFRKPKAPKVRGMVLNLYPVRKYRKLTKDVEQAGVFFLFDAFYV